MPHPTPPAQPCPQEAEKSGLPRRAVLTSAAWTIPAITLASAAPAFAASTTMACSTLPLTYSGAQRSILPNGESSLRNPQETGWRVTGKYRSENVYQTHVSQEHYNYYSGYARIKDYSFQSFGDNINSSTVVSNKTNTVIVLEYTFAVRDAATIRVAGDFLFGYGQKEQGRTQRQFIDVDVIGLKGERTSVTNIAKLTHQRQDATGAFYPNAAVFDNTRSSKRITTANAARIETDASVQARGYTLVNPLTRTASSGEGRFYGGFDTTLLSDNVAGERTLAIRYTLTIPPSHVAHSDGNDSTHWVNDDVTVNC